MNKERAPRRLFFFGPAWGVGLGVLLLLAATLVTLSPTQDAGAADCPAQFTLDFSGLPAGTILSDQYASFGVHISAVANGGHPDALIVFDTNAPPTHDPDLAVDIGNIAVLAENVNDSNGDGLVDDPDENNFGGQAIFTFDQDVRIGSFVFVDHDHQPSDYAAAYDASGNLITKVLIPIAGNGSVQQIDVNADGVRRFELVYRDSGGFTGIEVECGGPTPTATPAGGGEATPTPTPTSAGEATPTPTPTSAGVATPTPATAGVTTSSPTPVSQPVAVAAVVQLPAPQAAPQPAAVPSMGGNPGEGGRAFSWTLVALMGIGLALSTGGALGLVREMARRD